MTPKRFRITRNLTAAIAAVIAVSVFLLGVDGLLGAMQRLTQLMNAAPPSAPAPAPAPVAEAAATPGIVPAFIVPADDAVSGRSAEAGTK